MIVHNNRLGDADLAAAPEWRKIKCLKCRHSVGDKLDDLAIELGRVR